MREIKFRGKDKNNNWVYGDIGHLRDIQAVIMEYAEEDFGSYFSEHIVVPETISQFTGLYDKNGKEIYENDIVKNTLDIGVVEYKTKHSAFVVKGWEYGYALWKDKTIEIIGNIFDNPELLGEQQ